MKMEYFLAIPIIVWGLVNFTTYRSVRLLAKPDELLKEAEAIDDEVFLSEKEEFDRWCQSNDFAHEKNFLFYGILNGPPIKCSSWWSSTDKTWALIYVTHMGKNIDFVTTYENGIGVTTASSKDSLTLPSAPNSYIQAFTKTSNDERYALHKHAVASIEKNVKLLKALKNKSFSN
ncbi:hypothetical protein [Teredinibacter turnerae]|uniref:hypothetical protein n=1 Tax=Teredinibacter turnerae TaxID=2426 RepID=UPI00036CE696|nr:hypothetical protein [Teredinibacter turnerae]